MATTQLSSSKVENQLFSKEAVNLPPRQRLGLLLKSKKYPIVKKRTSAVRQLEEMLDFYHLCCLMLAQYFPSEKAESNFFMLCLIASQKNTHQSIITGEFGEVFRRLGEYEELESKITAMQMLFYQYQHSFPDLYESYHLEDIATEQISNVIQETKISVSDNPQLIEETLERWELLS